MPCRFLKRTSTEALEARHRQTMGVYQRGHNRVVKLSGTVQKTDKLTVNHERPMPMKRLANFRIERQVTTMMVKKFNLSDE
jgi:hypothetical protein